MSSKPSSRNPLKHLKATDLRATAQLATEAVAGVARIAEGVHQSVWATLGVPGGTAPGQTGGITGLVYRGVHGATRLAGKGVDALLGRLQPLLSASLDDAGSTPQREAVLAALNGVIGDRLAASGNPLATRMSLRHQGAALDWQAPMPAVTGKILLLIHGLCMNDLQWQGPATDSEGASLPASHASALATELGYTPVFVRYNTGLHTSDNGQQLAALLEQLMGHWPVPIEDLTVLAHSMGGLVTRSAVDGAQRGGQRWPALLKHIIFLGTPHHGAPLERAGNWVDLILGSTAYSAPFAKLGQLRSAGITDLRHGHVRASDWQGRDRFQRQPDRRQSLPLPEGVACFTVAATLASQRSLLADRLLGDGLVPLRSALGQHDQAQRSLVFAKSSQWIAHRMNHMQLLYSPLVTQQLLHWLSPRPQH